MSKPIFYCNNLWDDYTISSGTGTAHENFPITNTQHRDFNKAWRSNYGAGSGWGLFSINSSVNNKLYFNEGGGTLTATLTGGNYDADTLATEIETQLEAAGADSYTVEYLESGSDANKFKITNDTDTFELECTNMTDAVWDTIGFDTSSDTGTDSDHTADEIRIHYVEFLYIDFGSAQTIYSAIIKGHNFSDTATVKVQFSDDNWSTQADYYEYTIQDDILVSNWSGYKNYRYVRFWMEDPDNSDTYIKVGRIYLGGQFQPARGFRDPVETVPTDDSFVGVSDGGQVSGTVQRSVYDVSTYTLPVENEKSSYDTVIDAVGTSKSFFFCEDPDSPLTTTKYVQAKSWRWRSYDDSTYELNVTLRELI